MAHRCNTNSLKGKDLEFQASLGYNEMIPSHLKESKTNKNLQIGYRRYPASKKNIHRNPKANSEITDGSKSRLFFKKEWLECTQLPIT